MTSIRTFLFISLTISLIAKPSNAFIPNRAAAHGPNPEEAGPAKGPEDTTPEAKDVEGVTGADVNLPFCDEVEEGTKAPETDAAGGSAPDGKDSTGKSAPDGKDSTGKSAPGDKDSAGKSATEDKDSAPESKNYAGKSVPGGKNSTGTYGKGQAGGSRPAGAVDGSSSNKYGTPTGKKEDKKDGKHHWKVFKDIIHKVSRFAKKFFQALFGRGKGKDQKGAGNGTETKYGQGRGLEATATGMPCLRKQPSRR